MTARLALVTRIYAVEALAAHQGGVLSRGQLYELGVTRGEVRNHVRALRWRRLGAHCVLVHRGPLTDATRYWSAVLEAGPRAYVDGESAVILAGLTHYRATRIRVSVPRGARIRHRGTSVDIRQTRRWRAEDVIADGIPRARPEVGVVRGALWAASDRQAMLLVTMAVQQKVVTLDAVAAELLRIRRDRRRRLLHDLMLELAGGIGSLSELDVVRGCRERGIPPPEQQALRRTTSGSYFLDLRWRRWKVVVEVDGIHHAWAQNLIADALRHNSIAIEGDVVLRLPVMGLRVCPDEFFGQIGLALRRAGWRTLAG